jgi:tRNA threonylcarbamoyladenosine biosynthesis protein TsaB
MRFLVLDTADSRGSVAVFGGPQLLQLESHSTDEDYSVWLLPAAHRALTKSGLTLSQLDGYAACAGPGSFTGLRVGLTTVKAWAEIYCKPVVGLSRLECLANSPPGAAPATESFVAAGFDAHRNQIFAALYRTSERGLRRLGDELVIGPADFLGKIADVCQGHPVRWRTPDPQLLTSQPAWSVLSSQGHVLEEVQPPFADRLGWLALEKFRRGETQDALSLDAEYVRRSDAELFWKRNPSGFRP